MVLMNEIGRVVDAISMMQTDIRVCHSIAGLSTHMKEKDTLGEIGVWVAML